MSRAIFVVLAVLLATPAFAQPQNFQTFTSAPLSIDTAKGPQHFTVELALTPDQQEQGLMYRPHLAADAGMLFVMAQPQIMTFWMHNTLIPLDMLFIAAGGKIVDLHERAMPMSDATIVSHAPATAVLELNGGTVDRLGIKIGDVVHAAALGDAVN
ncbi:MAG TPA: DUF192 domain-containing protein [Stellaceae bacterium]|nr:DUF192 domain-containing protein [Stellaceae bacterium]